MEEELRSNLLALADAFAATKAGALSTVGMKSVRDGRFFDRLRGGGGFTVKTYDTVFTWFARNWPADADWPADVPARPSKPEAA